MRFLNILNQEVIQNGIIDFKKSRWFCPIGWILPSGRVYREGLLATGLFCLFPPNMTIFVSNMTMLAKIWPYSSPIWPYLSPFWIIGPQYDCTCPQYYCICPKYNCRDEGMREHMRIRESPGSVCPGLEVLWDTYNCLCQLYFTWPDRHVRFREHRGSARGPALGQPAASQPSPAHVWN